MPKHSEDASSPNGVVQAVTAAGIRLGDDLFGAGVIKAILSEPRVVVVTTLDDRIFSLDPFEEVTVRRV